jgi:hypothetical protein
MRSSFSPRGFLKCVRCGPLFGGPNARGEIPRAYSAVGDAKPCQRLRQLSPNAGIAPRMGVTGRRPVDPLGLTKNQSVA